MSDFQKIRLEVLRNLGFKPRTILDIGAFKGEWSKVVREIWPDAKVFMVEANGDLQEPLEEAIWADGYEIALLGDKKRQKVNYFASKSEMTTGNSIFKEQTYVYEGSSVRHLPMTTLDSLVETGKLKNIDFIKIDTQGSELSILDGGKKTVAKAEFILLETQNLTYNLGAPDVFAVMEKMKNLGFALFDIVEMHYLPKGEMAQVDMLFAKKPSKFVKRGKLF